MIDYTKLPDWARNWIPALVKSIEAAGFVYCYGTFVGDLQTYDLRRKETRIMVKIDVKSAEVRVAKSVSHEGVFAETIVLYWTNRSLDRQMLRERLFDEVKLLF